MQMYKWNVPQCSVCNSYSHFAHTHFFVWAEAKISRLIFAIDLFGLYISTVSKWVYGTNSASIFFNGCVNVSITVNIIFHI